MVSIKQRLTVLAVAAFEVNEIPQGGLEDLLSSLQVALQTFFYGPFMSFPPEKSAFLLQKLAVHLPRPWQALWAALLCWEQEPRWHAAAWWPGASRARADGWVGGLRFGWFVSHVVQQIDTF